MKLKTLTILFLFVFLSGCGTYKVITNPPQEYEFFPLYKGFQYDEIRFFNGTVENWQAIPFWIIDMPFSIVADTVMIPYYSYEFITEGDNHG
jgi:uncharacterized protein YceK